MSTAVLAPASTGSMPAFSQVHKPSRGQKRKSKESTGDKPAKKYTVEVRRKPGDFIPAPTGDEEVDVERRWQWVQRGSCKPRDRLINFRGVRNMDIDEAYAMLQRDRRQRAPAAAILPTPTPSPDETVAYMAAVGAQPLLFTQPGFLQAPSFGPQQPTQDFGLLPAQLMGPQNPFFTTAEAFQPLFYMDEGLPLTPPQVAMPVQQTPAALSQQTDFLHNEDFTLGAGFLPADMPPFDPLQDMVNVRKVTEDLQGALLAPNGAASVSLNPSEFESTPLESDQDFASEGGVGLEAQMDEVLGEPLFDFSKSDFDALFNFEG